MQDLHIIYTDLDMFVGDTQQRYAKCQSSESIEELFLINICKEICIELVNDKKLIMIVNLESPMKAGF